MMIVCLTAAVLVVISPVDVEPPTFPAREFNVVDYGGPFSTSGAVRIFRWLSA